MQVQGSAHEHDAAVNLVVRSTHSTDVFVFDVVREGNCCLAGVRGLFSTNLQLPVQHDPLGGQFNILIVSEAQFAVDRQTVQRRSTDIEDNIHAIVDGDKGAFGWHLLVCPGG